MKKALLLVATIFCATASTIAAEADTNSVTTTLDEIAILAGNPKELTDQITDAQKADLFNSAARLLKDYIAAPDANTNAYLQIIKDLNINFKVFDADTTGGDAGLGFSYAFDRSVAGRTINPAADNPLGASFSIHAKGNVAFDKEKNPDDFLESGVKLHLFQSIGGWEPAISEKLVPFKENGVVKMENGQPVTITEVQELIRSLDLNLTESERAKDAKWQEFLKFVNSRAKLQVLWDVAGDFALESNQSFSKKQFAYGGQGGLLLRAWNPTSPWARWNILDYPFAAIRFLTRADETWNPSGQALPSFIAGVDLVSPISDAPRFAVDPTKDDYPRFRGEVAMKTRVARFKGEDFWLSLSYRRFQELGASAAIRAAGLESTDYFAAQLDLIYGFNLSYSTGRLPLDRESDRVIAVGWKLNW